MILKYIIIDVKVETFLNQGFVIDFSIQKFTRNIHWFDCLIMRFIISVH